MHRFLALLTSLVIFLLLHPLNAAWGQLEQLRRPRLRSEAVPSPPAPMVVIPEGWFVMGANGTDALEDERPQHEIWLDRYEMDQYEVTTGHYAEFLVVAKQPTP